jgi:hypothetical protein
MALSPHSIQGGQFRGAITMLFIRSLASMDFRKEGG